MLKPLFTISVLAVAALVATVAPSRAQQHSLEYMASFAAAAQRTCKFTYRPQAQKDIDTVLRGAAGNAWRMQQVAEGEAAARALGRNCKALSSTVAGYSW